MSQAEVKLLKQELSQWTRHHRLQRSLTWAWRGMLAGGLIALIATILLVLQERILSGELVAIVVAASLITAILVGVLAYFWRQTSKQAARFFDKQLGLKERVSTALELSTIDITDKNELVDRQHRDTLDSISQVDIGKQIPLRLDWREISLIAVLILGVGATLFYAAPRFARATTDRANAAAIEEEIVRIEEIKANIEADQSLSEAQQSSLTEPLNEALEQLEEAKSLEEALATLSQTQQELQGLSDPALSEQIQGLQAAGQQLAQGDSSEPLNDFGESLAGGELEQAAQDLAQIDPGELAPPELNDLSAELSEAAELLAESNPELSQQLAEAAQALENGDLETAREVLADAADAVEGTGEEVTVAEIAGEAANELGEGADAIAQVGVSELLGQSGQNGNLVEGPGTSGAGNGEFTEPLGPGSEVGPSKINQENLAGDGGEVAYEPIYAPENLGGEDALGGALAQGDVEGETLGTTASNPDDSNASSVPYVQVLAEYEEVYRAALENDEVPLEWRNTIRDYFSSLQP